MSSIQMIGLSRTTGYAIQALSCLNDPACTCRSIANIAGCSSVPRAYLAKIVPALVRAGLATAMRGAGGGITLLRQPAEISLLQIVEAVEGGCWMDNCLLGYDCSYDSRSCPTEKFWKRTRTAIEDELRRTTLADAITCTRNRPTVAKGAQTPNGGCRAAGKRTSEAAASTSRDRTGRRAAALCRP